MSLKWICCCYVWHQSMSALVGSWNSKTCCVSNVSCVFLLFWCRLVWAWGPTFSNRHQFRKPSSTITLEITLDWYQPMSINIQYFNVGIANKIMESCHLKRVQCLLKLSILKFFFEMPTRKLFWKLLLPNFFAKTFQVFKPPLNQIIFSKCF